MPDGKHILIVDDEKFLCVTVADFLRDAKYRVSIAFDGSEVAPILDREKVHLVLLDLVMPKLGGFETLAVIKKKSPETRVIILTAFGSSEQVQQAKKEGADGFISKPFSVEKLLARVAEVLSGSAKGPFHELGLE